LWKLLEYIKDAFIEELLAGITYYMSLCDKPDLRRNAEQKANDMLTKLKKYLK
jgi:hypothetical protein